MVHKRIPQTILERQQFIGCGLCQQLVTGGSQETPVIVAVNGNTAPAELENFIGGPEKYIIPHGNDVPYIRKGFVFFRYQVPE